MLETSMFSRPGTRRTNEDAVGVCEREGKVLAVLADGLGGQEGGDLASKIVVESCQEEFTSQAEASWQEVKRLLEAAQVRLRREQEERQSLFGMRSTAVLLLFYGQRAAWGHVGDSRVYWFRGGKLREQTKDHSVPQMLVQMGELKADQIRFHPDRNRLLKAMGGEWGTRPYTIRPDLLCEQGDAFLLCSDGFWEFVLEPEMEAALCGAASPGEWLERMEEAALSRAGKKEMDNYSAIAAWVK